MVIVGCRLSGTAVGFSSIIGFGNRIYKPCIFDFGQRRYGKTASTLHFSQGNSIQAAQDDRSTSAGVPIPRSTRHSAALPKLKGLLLYCVVDQGVAICGEDLKVMKACIKT